MKSAELSSRWILPVLVVLLLPKGSAEAVPYFARKFDTQCATCHSFPPRLNEFGLEFAARGYRAPGLTASRSTLPAAVWITERVHRSDQLKVTRAFLHRLEFISGGELTDRISYFVEWRTISLENQRDGSLRDRSGRFEDLFLLFDLTENLTLTTGQFRMLSQWDVSRRLSASTPAAFSASVPAPDPPPSRIGSLRYFSLEGRAPALRLSHFRPVGAERLKGWQHEWTIPFGGEFSAPISSEARELASFELEARPKGIFYETFYRSGLDSVGGGVFIGRSRLLLTAVGQKRFSQHHFYGSVGSARFPDGRREVFLTVGDYWIPRRWTAVGARLDHRSGDGLGPALVPHFNFQFPGGTYTFMLVVEPFLQARNSGLMLELHAVF